MFQTLIAKLPQDNDYPARAFVIDVYSRVLNGTLYDHLHHPFHVEKNNVGEYIRLVDRRPSVRYALAKIVVDNSVSMLFSEGHFPDIDCDDEVTRDVLQAIAKESRLNEVMIEAATIGSAGSVAIILQVLNNRLFFKPLWTKYLTPTFDPQAPDTLLKVREQRKVDGKDLKVLGYDVDESKEYWFAREWDSQYETYYLPWPVKDEEAKIVIDTQRTVHHQFDFVPMVWIKNLPGGDEIDGECTFRAAIDTSIEIDYQLSQAGRGLRYSSDPTLLIKEPALGQGGELVKSSGTALVVGEDGDAKYLEINGSAANVVLEYVRNLRELALESIHGNRSNADKLSAAQSGRAMELMNQSLVWLADRLRITYGEGGLLTLLKLIVKASQKYPIDVNGEKMPELSQKANISLRWPAWYAPTADDKQKIAVTLKTLDDSGHISRETAVKSIAADYDIEDVSAELDRIAADEIAKQQLLKPNVTENMSA